MDITALKDQLQQRANLSPEQAEQAAQVALQFFTERVPQLESLVDKAGGVGQVSKRLGGLFGRRG